MFVTPGSRLIRLATCSARYSHHIYTLDIFSHFHNAMRLKYLIQIMNLFLFSMAINNDMTPDFDKLCITILFKLRNFAINNDFFIYLSFGKNMIIYTSHLRALFCFTRGLCHTIHPLSFYFLFIYSYMRVFYF